MPIKWATLVWICSIQNFLHHKMFSHINELLKLTDEDEHYLIHKDNNLTKVLHQFKKVGYEPYIRYRAGRISELNMKFIYKSADTKRIIRRKAQPYNIPTQTFEDDKTITYIVSTQDLSKDTLERDISTDLPCICPRKRTQFLWMIGTGLAVLAAWVSTSFCLLRGWLSWYVKQKHPCVFWK